MPLVKVNLLEGRSRAAKEAIGVAIQAALVENLGVPVRIFIRSSTSCRRTISVTPTDTSV